MDRNSIQPTTHSRQSQLPPDPQFCTSPAGDLGFSELTIAALLGHSARGVTQRYIHIDEALKMTADRVAAEMADILDGRATPSRQRVRRAEVAERVPEQAGS